MTFIRKVVTSSGATAIQIARKSHGRIVHIEHIGSAHNEADIQLLMALARKRMLSDQQSLLPEPENLRIEIKQAVSSVLLDVLGTQYERLGFSQLADEDFKNLVIARLVEPTSKLGSLWVLADLGITGIREDRLYRCLKRVVAHNYRNQLSGLCFAHASKGNSISLVLYDVTTLYFEIQKEDEEEGGNNGYRKPGMSKERRLEPQIIVGLLVDQTGFPLELHSFEGNKAETKTIVPVVDAFRKRHGLVGVTVVADAGMLSADNLKSLAAAGYTYIVGSRMHKIPYEITEFRKTNEKLIDGQIITAKTTVPGQRIVYQYREKRAKLDLRNIEKQVEKARKIVAGTASSKRAKFLSVTTKHRELNEALVDKATALAGIKGYVTNLPRREVSNESVIAYYHQLWHVEQSFRMSKSDLKARPIFHRVKDAIEAHLTVVMAALAIQRQVEQVSGLTRKQLVRRLRPLRSGKIVIDNKEHLADAYIPDEIKPLLKKLGSGH